MLQIMGGIDVDYFWEENLIKENFSWRTPLQFVCATNRLNATKILLTVKDISVNITDNLERTPLYNACQNGHSDVIKELLKAHGIEVNQADKYGETPLYIACQEDH